MEDVQFWGAANFWEYQILGSGTYFGATNFWVWQVLGSCKFWDQQIL